MTAREDGLAQELIDAATRMKDAINLHVVAGNLGVRERAIGYVAIRLEDGRALDNTLYESRREAAHYTQNKERGLFYVKVGAESMGEREAVIVLQMARQAFKNGVVFAEEDPIVPMLSELAAPYIPNTLQKLGGLIPPPRRRKR